MLGGDLRDSVLQTRPPSARARPVCGKSASGRAETKKESRLLARATAARARCGRSPRGAARHWAAVPKWRPCSSSVRRTPRRRPAKRSKRSQNIAACSRAGGEPALIAKVKASSRATLRIDVGDFEFVEQTSKRRSFFFRQARRASPPGRSPVRRYPVDAGHSTHADPPRERAR